MSKQSGPDGKQEDPADAYTPVPELLERLPKGGFTLSILARRNSGKTVLISEIIRELLKQKRVDIVYIMSGSAGLTKDYSFLPPEFVQPFSEQVLENIWNLQVKTEPEKRKHVLVVLDDCLATPDAFSSQNVNRYMTLGRHAKCSLAILSQHTGYLTSPIRRANSDLILWSKLNIQQLTALHNSTTNISKTDFIKLSEKLGGVKYNFMCLDNYVGSSDWLEFLTFTRAAKK